MGKDKALNFRFHGDVNLLNLSFLSAVEYSFLMVILYNLKDKGDDLVVLSSYDFRLKPLKQKSQISLVFGMNALVPLGTI
ncbi:hypothetical protein [Helicobacter pylori]|uniref:hypothetical protein n=1 Tax=Helicobacter pylori TaxID=210 RepID=UPI0027398963|nr:hypothetical protein [Helicobacter pylori]